MAKTKIEWCDTTWQPADWVKEVDGVKYRAFYFKGMKTLISYRIGDFKKSHASFLIAEEFFKAAFCNRESVPIMPYSLSQGKYEYSK